MAPAAVHREAQAGRPSASCGGRFTPRRSVQIPAGCGRSACLAEPTSSAGTTSTGSSANVEAFAIERHDVTNERYLEFVDAADIATRWWRPDDWAWLQREAVAHPLSGSSRQSVVLARMFELIPPPPAWPVCKPGRGVGADAGTTPACRPAEFQREVRIAGRRTRAPVGQRRAGRDARRSDFAS